MENQTVESGSPSDDSDGGADEGPSTAGIGESDPRQAFKQRLVELSPRAWVTPTIVALNVIVFVLMVASGVHWLEPDLRDLVAWGADLGTQTVSGEWWRLWTSNYIHIGLVHIAFNMIVLFDAGRTVERMVGSVGYAVMYTITGIAGSLLSVAVHPEIVSAGASGAVFGVFGCLLGVLVVQRASIPAEELKRLGRDAGLLVLYNVVLGAGSAAINNAAHLGGLGAGLLCGLLLGLPLTREGLSSRGSRAMLVTIAGAAGIGLGGLALAPGDAAGPAAGVSNKGTFLLGKKLSRHRTDIHYGDDATEAHARGLADFLEQTGFIEPENEATVILRGRDGGFTIAFVIAEEARDDTTAIASFQTLGREISREVFDGAPVTVQFLTDELELARELETQTPSSPMSNFDVNGFAFGLDLKRLRAGALYAPHEADVIAGLRESSECMPAFYEAIDDVRFRYLPGARAPGLFSLRGLDRDALDACAKQGAMKVSHDDDFTLIEEPSNTVLVRWLDAETMIFALAEGDVQEGTWITDRDVLMEHDAGGSLEEVPTLTRLVEERGDAAIWAAVRFDEEPTHGDEGLLIRATVSDALAIEARARFASEAFAASFVDTVRPAFEPVLGSPFPQLLLSKFTTRVDGRELIAASTLYEADLITLAASFSTDEALQRALNE